MLGRGERASFSARRVSVAKPQGTARRVRGRRTVHRGSMPSTVRHRCSVLYVFSLYLLLSLFLSPHTPWLSAAGYYILAPALSPGSLFHIGRILVGRSLEVRMSLAMIEKGRRRPLPPPRVSLCSKARKRNDNKEERDERCALELHKIPGQHTRDYPSY